MRIYAYAYVYTPANGVEGAGDDLISSRGERRTSSFPGLLYARVTLETKESCRAASNEERKEERGKEITARRLPIKRIQRVVEDGAPSSERSSRYRSGGRDCLGAHISWGFNPSFHELGINVFFLIFFKYCFALF